MKLSNYENPVSGSKSSLFNIGNLWAQILGVFVFIMVFIFGQKLADFILPVYSTEPTKDKPEGVKKEMRFF